MHEVQATTTKGSSMTRQQMARGAGYVALFAVLVLALTFVGACRSTIDNGCKGGTEIVIGKRVDDGYWVLDTSCGKGGNKIYRWEPDDGNPQTGVGPEEWERHSPGDVFAG
jgi:hypothetical protein